MISSRGRWAELQRGPGPHVLPFPHKAAPLVVNRDGGVASVVKWKSVWASPC